MASKRLLLYAADACRLSSLLLRRAVQTRPATLEALRDGSRRVLLDQSRLSTANVAAIKLLEWDREINLMQYHGLQEYARRWWGSRSWSLPFMSSRSSGGGGRSKQSSTGTNSGGDAATNNSDDKKKNVARVAFMITSEQRHNLSMKLGYTSQDIRSLKPIEALLLLEHGVPRETSDGSDFRAKLSELMEENDRLMSIQHKDQDEQQPGKADDPDITPDRFDALETNTKQSLSPEEAQQLHAKPDVALALISADKDDKDEHAGVYSANEESKSLASELIPTDDSTSSDPIEDADEATSVLADPPQTAALSKPALVDVTPDESEQLHMKLDVAAAILTSQQREEQNLKQQLVDDRDGSTADADDDEQCWYEVIERLPAAPTSNSAVNGGNKLQSAASGREQVIALFPTKEEALECVRIKESFRRGKDGNNEAKGSEDGRFLVRRRWNA